MEQMDIEQIIEQLEAEKNRLENAIVALNGASAAKRNYTGKASKGKRKMSAKARKAIAKAQKERWAKHRKEQKAKEADKA